MKKLLLLLAMTAAALTGAAAHPHMSLVSKLEFEYDGPECRGFWLDWTFDPYFSASIIQERDADRNGRFDAAEIRSVHDLAFINLRKFGFFTFIRVGNLRRSPEKVERFTAEIRGDRLAYRFYVDLSGSGYGEDFSVAVIDTGYFCAVSYPPAAAEVRQLRAGFPAPKWELTANKDYPVHYDPSQSSSDTKTHSAWKPGLQTVYPEEIRARF